MSDRTDQSPATSEPAGKSRLRRALQQFLEVGFLMGLVVGAEYLLRDGRIGSFGVYPHPYWLVIVPLAAARGLGAGFLATAIATALYLFGASRELDTTSLNRLLSLDVMLDPILFASVTFVVGQFRDVMGEKLAKARKAAAEAEENALRMRGQRDVLTEANRVLERRLVDQNTHFGTLVDIVSRTENASRAEVFDVALEIVQEQCGAAASVLIPLVDGRVQPVGYRGWPEDVAEERIKQTVMSEAVRRAMLEGREINGFALGEMPKSGPLVVTPLTGASGVIEALLCLEDVPRSLLNASTVRTFQAIGRWASAVLARVEKGQNVADPGTQVQTKEPAREWLGTTQDFLKRLSHEYERSVRFGYAPSFLAIRVTGQAGKMSPSVRAVDEFVIERFAARVRSSDAVYRFPNPGCYLLVLAATPRAGAEVTLKRLMSEESRDWPAPGEVHLHVATPGPDTPDPESMMRNLVLAFQEDGEMMLASGMPVTLKLEQQVGTLEEFRRSLNAELGLAMRNEYPLHILAVRGEKTRSVDPAMLAGEFQDRVAGLLRGMDRAYAIGANHLAVILPIIDRHGAGRVAEKVRDALQEEGRAKAYGAVGVEILTFGPKYPYYAAFLEALSASRSLREVHMTGGSS